MKPVSRVFGVILLLLVLAIAGLLAATAVLDFPLRSQEHSQWCWAGSSQAVLSYFGTTVDQCVIANYASGRSDCCGSYGFDDSHPCNNPNNMWGYSYWGVPDGSLRGILAHWGVTSDVRYSSISAAAVIAEIGNGRPFVMRFGWTGGGGHFLDGYGQEQDATYLDYMDPWPGNGYTKSLYSWVVSAADHQWTHTLQITTPAAAPGAPSGLAADVAGPTVTLTWSAPVDGGPPAAYVIEAGSAPGASNLANFSTGTTQLSLIANGVANGLYYVRVRATNHAGTSGPSNEVSFLVGGAVPDAPSGLTAGATGSTVTLSWSTPSGGATPAAFIIEAGSATGLSDLADFSTGNTLTTYTTSGVSDGRYFIRVRAVNAAGKSGPSNEVLIVVGPAAPGPPSGLTWSSAGSSISLAWTAPSTGGAPKAYTIEAGSSSGLANLANFSTGNPATVYAAGGIGNGTYFVRVKGTNTGGTSGPSNEVALVVGCSASPGAASGLHTNSNNGGTVQFAWTAPNFAGTSNGPTTYILEAGKSPGASNFALVDLGGSGTTATFGGIGPGTY